MAYTAHPQPAPTELETAAYATAQPALPGPVRPNTAILEVKRTCAAAQTDVLMAASRALLQIVYKNDPASAASLTITPNGTDTIDGLTTYVLAPGDAVTLTNTTSTNWLVS